VTRNNSTFYSWARTFNLATCIYTMLAITSAGAHPNNSFFNHRGAKLIAARVRFGFCVKKRCWQIGLSISMKSVITARSMRALLQPCWFSLHAIWRRPELTLKNLQPVTNNIFQKQINKHQKTFTAEAILVGFPPRALLSLDVYYIKVVVQFHTAPSRGDSKTLIARVGQLRRLTFSSFSFSPGDIKWAQIINKEWKKK